MYDIRTYKRMIQLNFGRVYILKYTNYIRTLYMVFFAFKLPISNIFWELKCLFS